MLVAEEAILSSLLLQGPEGVWCKIEGLVDGGASWRQLCSTFDRDGDVMWVDLIYMSKDLLGKIKSVHP